MNDVVSRLELNLEDQDSVRITEDIRSKIAFLESGKLLDSKLISVTDDNALNGPFTFIEGNRRSVAFTYFGTIVGSKIYIGISDLIKSYPWAYRAYQT
ncbi:MAG: hypothetical protein ACI9FR_001193 [Cryomorphaceae bacterium]|jgi:hypothetical protein